MHLSVKVTRSTMQQAVRSAVSIFLVLPTDILWEVGVYLSSEDHHLLLLHSNSSTVPFLLFIVLFENMFPLPPALCRWGRNPRGVSYTFGHDVIEEFLTRHDLDLICRAHQVRSTDNSRAEFGAS